jgi:hypothetical protein
MEGVPKPVVERLNVMAGGAAIERVQQEREGGVVTWEGAWVVAGERHEAKVDAAGVLIEHEVEVAPEKVPVAVREAAQKELGGAAIKYVRIVSAPGELYEAEAGERELLIEANGVVKKAKQEREQDQD